MTAPQIAAAMRKLWPGEEIDILSDKDENGNVRLVIQCAKTGNPHFIGTWEELIEKAKK